MFIRYIVLLAVLGISNALPLPPIPSIGSEPQIWWQRSIPTNRTLISIGWSCISTIIICAWVSVHPNVPPSGHWRALRRRLEAMFWAIIAPELILAWAVRQWCAAWEIMDTVNGAEEGWLTGLSRTIRGWIGKKREPVAPRRWTMAHGHLLEMGGFTIVDPAFEDNDSENAHGQVLSFECYKDLATGASDIGFKLPKITVSDIQDRSKGDFLSKLIAILQTSWFILQCVARGQENLALTELELVTLALASLNAVTYAFWWHKPLGVQEPIRIYFKSRTESVTRKQNDAKLMNQPLSVNNVLFKIGMHVRTIATGMVVLLQNPCRHGPGLALLLWFGPVPFFLFFVFCLCLLTPFPLGIIFLLKVLKPPPFATEGQSGRHGLIAARILVVLRTIRYRLTSYIASVSERWLRALLDNFNFVGSAFFIGWLFILPALFIFLLATTILLFPFFILLSLVSFIFTAVFGIISSNTIAPGASHVPSFYAPPTKSDKYSRMVVFASFGVIFGGLHCIGWNFTYPTLLEQQLWRATSLTITFIPFIVAPIDFVLDNFELSNGWGKVVRLALDLVMTLLLFVYVVARLFLIVQALASLRRQPESAFVAVDWTQYIPHIF